MCPKPAQAKACLCKLSFTKVLNPKQCACHRQLLMSSSLHSYLSVRPPLHAYVGSSHFEWSCSIINRTSTSWMQVISTTICFLTRTILDPLTIHRPSRMCSYQPSADKQRKISKYFAEVYQCPWSHIELILPVTMACWDKVCIANGGDKRWSSSTVSEVQAETSHDSSFVWVSASTDIQLRLQWFRILYSTSSVLVRDKHRGHKGQEIIQTFSRTA